MLSLKNLVIVLILLNFSPSLLAQGEVAILPAFNPTHVQLKVMTAGKCLSNSEFITKSDREFTIQAYSFKGEELVVSAVSVDLVRKGRRIANESFAAKVDLSSLFTVAREGDVLRFQVNKVYVKDTRGKLQLYSDGMLNFTYRFRETESLGYIH